jgi:hypothetical protein
MIDGKERSFDGWINSNNKNEEKNQLEVDKQQGRKLGCGRIAFFCAFKTVLCYVFYLLGKCK